MRKKISSGLAVIVFLMFSAWPVSAGPVQAAKFKHADKNKDGELSKREMKMEKNWEQKQHSNVNTWWENRADTNSDGKVDNTELASWKQLERDRIDLNNDGTIDAKERRLSWRHARCRVSNDIEKKYDADSDGWLQPEEVKQMLRAKYAIVRTSGAAKVDSELEREYDTNSDGVIEQAEAALMSEDTQ